MIENQTDKYQDAYQKALSNIQDPTDVQKKALEYGEELEKTIKNIILFNICDTVCNITYNVLPFAVKQAGRNIAYRKESLVQL